MLRVKALSNPIWNLPNLKQTILNQTLKAINLQCNKDQQMIKTWKVFFLNKIKVQIN
jgi:hypothetical protein